MFNGWLRKHGFKSQTVSLPNGLIMDWFGLISMRRNDLYVLQKSNFIARFQAAQERLNIPLDEQFAVYGDGIYPTGSHVVSKRGVQDPAERQLHVPLCSCRQLVEWHYGEAESMWKYMATPKRLKMLNGRQCLRALAFCKYFLRNFYVCVYHDNTSYRFRIPPPTLEEYLV